MTTATMKVEHHLLELFDALWDDFVDPRDAYADGDGWWLPVGGNLGAAAGLGDGPFNEQALRRAARAVPAAGGDE